MSNNDAMLLSASIIVTEASVDYSVENQVLKVKKSRNLDFGQKVKNDFDLHICCHGNDLSDITNWQHIGRGTLWQKIGNRMLSPLCLRSQFSFVAPIFLRF